MGTRFSPKLSLEISPLYTFPLLFYTPGYTPRCYPVSDAVKRGHGVRLRTHGTNSLRPSSRDAGQKLRSPFDARKVLLDVVNERPISPGPSPQKGERGKLTIRHNNKLLRHRADNHRRTGTRT